MGQMLIYAEWAFKVSNAEMLVILKALGGRLRNEEDVAEAKALGDTLTRNRISELEHVTEHLKRSMGENS